jgi:Protein of unknown function (DUF3040)
VPLSEEEQRLLEQMEEALAAEDPKFASALQGARSRAHCKRMAIAGTVAFLLGVGLLLWGVMLPVTLVSVAGFIVMLAGSWLAVTNFRRLVTQDLPDNVVPLDGGRRGHSTSGFMNRMEDRWRRRRDGE